MDYQPISCDQHEQLELAVLRRLALKLHLKDGRVLNGIAQDVYTYEQAEWLRFQDREAGEITLRLDTLEQVTRHKS